MKTIFLSFVAVPIILLIGCSQEPEVVETQNVLIDPVDAGTQTMVTDAPDGPDIDWDTNGDSVFQEAEYDSFAGRGLTTWDLNDDNRLDRTEFDTGWNRIGWTDPAAAYAVLDDNGDDYLESSEWFTSADWREWDVNDDGVLDAREFYYG